MGKYFNMKTFIAIIALTLALSSIIAKRNVVKDTATLNTPATAFPNAQIKNDTAQRAHGKKPARANAKKTLTAAQRKDRDAKKAARKTKRAERKAARQAKVAKEEKKFTPAQKKLLKLREMREEMREEPLEKQRSLREKPLRKTSHQLRRKPLEPLENPLEPLREQLQRAKKLQRNPLGPFRADERRVQPMPLLIRWKKQRKLLRGESRKRRKTHCSAKAYGQVETLPLRGML